MESTEKSQVRPLQIDYPGLTISPFIGRIAPSSVEGTTYPPELRSHYMDMTDIEGWNGVRSMPKALICNQMYWSDNFEAREPYFGGDLDS